MLIRFNRKKEITVRTTRAPDEKIKVQAYPVQLHPNFPLNLAVYRDPCNHPHWTCCEWTTGIYLGTSLLTRKATVHASDSRNKQLHPRPPRRPQQRH